MQADGGRGTKAKRVQAEGPQWGFTGAHVVRL